MNKMLVILLNVFVATTMFTGCGKQDTSVLEKNAQALLIGYLRPIVANITNVSKFPAYNLPFINLNE